MTTIRLIAIGALCAIILHLLTCRVTVLPGHLIPVAGLVLGAELVALAAIVLGIIRSVAPVRPAPRWRAA